MSYMNHAEFAPAYGIQELSLDEMDLVGAGLDLREAGNIIMAGGAIATGIGALTGNPILIAGGGGISAIGGAVYLAGVFYQKK